MISLAICSSSPLVDEAFDVVMASTLPRRRGCLHFQDHRKVIDDDPKQLRKRQGVARTASRSDTVVGRCPSAHAPLASKFLEVRPTTVPQPHWQLNPNRVSALSRKLLC